MSSHKIKARELRDVSVGFVSFVKRGANRLPFRMTKGDSAMLDIGSFFIRKADSDEAERVSARKSEDMIKAATDILLRAGYAVGKVGAAKSEPASDGSGADETKNPAEGVDAGGKRDTGDGSSDTANPIEGKDAGGPRNDGQGKGVQMAKADAKGENELEKNETPNTSIGKSRVPKKPMEQDDMDDVDTAKADNEEEGDVPPQFEKFKAKAKKAAKNPADDEDAADGNSDEADEGENPAEMKKKAKKSDADLDAEAGIAALSASFAKVDRFMHVVSDQIEVLIQKTEAAAEYSAALEVKLAKTEGRISGLVVGQPASDLQEGLRKSDTSFPLLDTGYSASRA